MREIESVAETGVRPVPIGPVVRARTRTAIWLAYLVAGALLTVVYYTVDARHLLVWAPIGVSAVAATVVGIVLNRPAERVAWSLFAVALALFAAGDATYDVLTVTFHQDNPFPSLADAFYLLMYPVVAVGLLRLIRARSVSRDTGSLIDALILTCGLGLLSWIYLILPYVEADDLTVVQRVVAIAYPLGDVLVLALLARLVAGGLRIRSLRWLVVGIAGLLVADVFYGSIQLTGDWTVGGPVDLGWVIFYTAWGAAALHPSMRRVSEPLPVRSGTVSARRLLLLSLASLIAPAVLLLQDPAGQVEHSATIAVFSAVLYLLVVIRLAGIVRTHEASVQRERALRASGELLVAAQGADDVRRVAIVAAERLAGAQGVVGSAIHPADGPVPPDAWWEVARRGGGLIDSGRLSISPLTYDDRLRALLAVRTSAAMTVEVHGALSTLASQVALALESAELADAVRRTQNEAHFKGLIQNASDVIVVLSRDGIVDFATPSLQRCLGRSPEDLLGSHIAALLDAGSASPSLLQLDEVITSEHRREAVAEWRLQHGDGGTRPFEVTLSNLLDDVNVGGVVLTMRDVSERRALEEQLRHQAFHDGLTGLANRVLFHDRARQALARGARQGQTLALVMLDLDDFKTINDRLGHSAGDQLLTATAQRLTAGVRAGDTVARLGGDEFAVLMEDIPGEAEARELTARLVHAVSQPIMLFGEEVLPRASAGLVVRAAGGVAGSPIDLMRQADLALYSAKEKGKGQVVDYADELHVKVLDRETRRRELRQAIDGNQFVLHYQPVVRIATGEIVGAEALVRWKHPERGMLGPGEFITAAEESGLIVDLGFWVLSEALRAAGGWPTPGGEITRLSVNVSARQLQESDFAARALALVEESGVRPQDLVLEITESVLVSKGPVTLAALNALRERGVRIAVDDFGVGYSSLAYLQELPIDILKIDKSFVENLDLPRRRGAPLAGTVVSLAHSLHLEVIAEGIERVEQRDQLHALGCTLGQGYLLARPMNGDDFARALAIGRLGPPAPEASTERGHPAP
ncbi:MAG: EAL domain-containing protein, partial [Kineosporiaceae bacterium]